MIRAREVAKNHSQTYKEIIMATQVHRYEGGNHIIDRLLSEHFPDDVVWIVNGVNGKRPMVAGSGEEAKARYDKERSKWEAR